MNSILGIDDFYDKIHLNKAVKKGAYFGWLRMSRRWVQLFLNVFPTGRVLGQLKKACWVPMEVLGFPYPGKTQEVERDGSQIVPIYGMPHYNMTAPAPIQRWSVFFILLNLGGPL